MKAVTANKINIGLLVLMLCSAGGAIALRPSHKVADFAPGIDLATLIPSQIGEWKEENRVQNLVVDPGQIAMLEKIYTQTLTRTYKNKQGDRIMLSIAYGNDQRDGMQLHKPEVCYPAQGFLVVNKQTGTLQLDTEGANNIPVTRLETVLGNRYEPVTYWTTVGEHVYSGMIDKKIAEMRYGLAGKIPDGMLIRISSIDTQTKSAYALHAGFASEMLMAVPESYRTRLAGHGGAGQ